MRSEFTSGAHIALFIFRKYYIYPYLIFEAEEEDNIIDTTKEYMVIEHIIMQFSQLWEFIKIFIFEVVIIILFFIFILILILFKCLILYLSKFT